MPLQRDQGVTAAYVALNHGGEGSNPSDPTISTDRLMARRLARNEVMRVQLSLGALATAPNGASLQTTMTVLR